MDTTPNIQPGDFILVKTHHFVSKLIRFGQRDYGEPYASFNHVAVYVGNGEIVEALTHGVVLSPADKYPAADVRIISADRPQEEPHTPRERANAVSFARSCVGESYGWATIAAIALKVLFKGKWQFGVQGTSICSGLDACSLQRLGMNWNPYDPAELTPAFLARQYL